MRNKLTFAVPLLAVCALLSAGCAVKKPPQPPKEPPLVFVQPPACAIEVQKFSKAFVDSVFKDRHLDFYRMPTVAQNNPQLYVTTFLYRVNFEYSPDSVDYKARFYYNLKNVFPDYEKFTAVTTEGNETIRTVTLPKDKCGAVFVISEDKNSGAVRKIEIKFAADATGTCKRETLISENLRKSVQALINHKETPESVVPCTEVPKSHKVKIRDETDEPMYSDPDGWYVYSAVYCHNEEGRLIHYAWQTKEQARENRKLARKYAEEDRRERAEKARKRRADALYEFTVLDNSGREHRCGRPSKYDPITCD
jgi:hypothetical protein